MSGFIDAIVDEVRRNKESTHNPMIEYEKTAKRAAFEKMKRALESDNEKEFYEVMAEIRTFDEEINGDIS